MTQSTGIVGRGIRIEVRRPNQSPRYIPVANITNISVVSRSVDEIDFTSARSSRFKDVRPTGWADPGTLRLDYHYTPTDKTIGDLFARWVSGELMHFRINYGRSVAHVEYGYGYVVAPGDVQVALSQPISGSAVLRLRGAMEVTALGLNLISRYPSNSPMLRLGWI